MAQRFAKKFKTVESMNGGQHMRRVGALGATGFDQALVAQQGQQRVEEEAFGLAVDETSAELAQDRGIKAWVVEREGEGIFPV